MTGGSASLKRLVLVRPQGRLALFVLALLCGQIIGCASELPGPLECERMAQRLVGKTEGKLTHSPRLNRVIAKLTQACLTTPFDRRAVSCIEKTDDLKSCIEQLAYRAPERRSALEAFLEGRSGRK